MLQNRRAFFGSVAAFAAAGIAKSARSQGTSPPRVVRLNNLHTNEAIEAAYWENGAYVPDALNAVNSVLRDFRSGDVHPIDPQLLDHLVAVSFFMDAKPHFEVISGYRSPATNAMLHAESGQVAAHSLHMEGRAIDVRLVDWNILELQQAALNLGFGGVGFYPYSDFVHLDTGSPRTWQGS